MKSVVCLMAFLLIFSTSCDRANQPQKQSPKDSPIAEEYLRKGWENMLGHNYTEAIENFTKLIEIEPSNIKAYSSRASAKRYSKDYSGAIKDNTKAIELGPNDMYIANEYTSRGESKGYLKDHYGAIADYSKAIEIDQYTEAYWLRGLEKNDLEDFSGAIADLGKYVECSNANPANIVLAFYLSGLAKIKIGQKENGCQDLSKSGELGYGEAYKAIEQYCQ